MLSGIRRLLGNIHIVEDRGMITVEGLPTRIIEKDLYKIWSTSRIFDNMFTKRKTSSISFNSFFALDFVYTLNKIMEIKGGGFNYRALSRIVELMYKDTWLKQTLYEHPNVLNMGNINRIKKTPLEGQIAFLETYNRLVPQLNLKGYMLAADPGTGKTISGLLLGACLDTDINIFIVPKSSIDLVWKETLENELVKPERNWYSSGNAELRSGYKNYVFHYEQLARAIEFFKGQRFRLPMLWLDESHNLNEMDSERSKLFIQLSRVLSCKHVVWASGTPIKAIGKEVIPFLETIDSFFDADARERFLAIFGKNTARAIDILAARLGQNMVRVSKATVRPERGASIPVKVTIPNGDDYTLDAVREKMRNFITIRMEYYQAHMGEYLKMYNHCLNLYEKNVRPSQKVDYQTYLNYVKEIRNNYDPVSMKDMVKFCNVYEKKIIIPVLPQPLREEFRQAKSVVKYYQLKVQGEALGRILGRLRSQCHVDMIPHSNLEELIDTAEKKTIIFTSYVEVVKHANAYLRDKGYVPVMIYAETNKDLTSLIKAFAANVDQNPIIATYDSLSTAVPMVMANTCIMMNAPFRDFEYQQAVARVDRNGQDSDVYVYDVSLDTGKIPNISTRSQDIMSWSKEQVAALMGQSVDAEIALECFDPRSGLSALDIEALYQRPLWHY